MPEPDPAILRAVDQHVSVVLDLTRQIAEIPAPTFHEEERAAFARDRFAAQGLKAWIDSMGNAFARRPGAGLDGAILVSAHTDTVFPADTDLAVRQQEDRLIGPGIGDNSLAVAALLTLPRILDVAGVRTGADLLLCGNVGEEGLGNLRGIRQAVNDHRDGLRSVIVLEGQMLGRVVNQGVGSRRLRIIVEGPGGHSWGAFGKPSAIHVLGEIIAAIARLPVPAEPKTTFNVGQIEGGVSINTIAPRASLLLDMRSVDPSALADLAARVEEIVREANDVERGITVRSEVIGERPAGSIPVATPIVRLAMDILRSLGVEPHLHASSTDANIPIAEGIPAVCVGLTRGGNSHRTDEYIEMAPVPTGLQQLALLVAAAAQAAEV